jgi:hypothetical protein
MVGLSLLRLKLYTAKANFYVVETIDIDAVRVMRVVCMRASVAKKYKVSR